MSKYMLFKKFTIITLSLLLSLLFVVTVAFSAETPVYGEGIAKFTFNMTPDKDKLIIDPIKKQERREFIKTKTIDILKKTSSIEAVEEWLQSQGIIKLVPVEETEITDEIGIMSTSDNIATPTVSVYYDSLADEYTINGNWKWLSGAWVNDLPSGFGGNVGGHDVSGIWFADGINLKMVDNSAYMLMRKVGNQYWGTTANISDWDSNGVALQAQDNAWVANTAYNYDYNFDSGYSAVTVYTVQPTSCYVRTKFGHTWSSTGISSVNVTSSGISISFTNTSNRWDKTSNIKTFSFN